MQIHENTPIQPGNYTRIFVTHAVQKGACREDLLSAAGINEAFFDKNEAHINFTQYRKLYKKAIETVSDPSLFLSYGKSLGFAGHHGQLGTAVFSSSNFESALLKIRKYIKILAVTYDFNVTFTGADATILIDSKIPDKSLYIHEIEQFISGMFYCIEIMPNMKSNMKAVHLAFPKPSYSNAYHEIFGDICQFDCKNNEIVFSIKELNKYWIQGNPALEKIATKHCEEAFSQLETLPLLSHRILKTLSNHVDRIPKQSEVARLLGVSIRTMVRYLEQENTSYMEIVDTLRKDRALVYLNTPSWSVEDIAGMLGYSSASNFSRAFKKWTGEPPSNFRESQQC